MKDEWTCPGGENPHPAALEPVEKLRDVGRNSIWIEHCGSCGTFYRHLWIEVNDWGENGDYWSETHIWTPLTEDEFRSLRADPAFEPGAEPAHRWDSGWRAG